MVFCWGLSDNKSPQVSRSLLSILLDLSNVVVRTDFARPVISKSSSPCTNLLVTVPRAPITIGIIVTFMFYSFFNSLTKSKNLSFFSHRFNFTLWLARTAKPTILQVLSFFFFFFFFFDYYKIWSSRRGLVFRLNIEIPDEFVPIILWDRFWVVHISFVRMVNLQLLAQFPVDHIGHPIVPSLIFFLC